MGLVIGLLIITIGSFCQSSSYIPINKISGWSWENFWLIQGVFAWLIFPYVGVIAAIPASHSVIDIFNVEGVWKAMLYGLLWGIGGLTFGLSMRYLGVALGQSISLGTCSAFGTLLPALFAKTDLLHGEGLILLIGICLTMIGIAIIGYSGSLRSKLMSKEMKIAAIKDFAMTKGLFVALLAGVMSACFALGLNAAVPIKNNVINLGVSPLLAGLPTVAVVTTGGFITNAGYCLWQNFRNKTFRTYIAPAGKVIFKNIGLCILAGLLWYSQFFGLEIGKSFLSSSPLLLAFSWSILMSLNVIFSNVWGIILKEWKGTSRKAVITLVVGLIILVFSIIFPSIDIYI